MLCGNPVQSRTTSTRPAGQSRTTAPRPLYAASKTRSTVVRNEQAHEAWRSELLRSLPDYLEKPDTADVCVLLGEDQLYVHKLVLHLNSSIVHSQTELLEGRLVVELLDFSEHKDIVTDIITSFYTGHISITDENIKVVYKFAKVFSVTWLSQHALGLFDKMIDASFVDILQYSHTISCKQLKEACLVRLTRTLVDTLVSSGDWVTLDYLSIRTVVKATSVNLPELQVFELVTKWFEHDPEGRKRNIGELLDNLRYQLIPKEDLVGRVYDWMSNIQEIGDKTRLQLLININRHINVPGILTVPAHTPASSLPAQAHETTLRHILDSVQNKNSAKCTSSAQLLGLLQDNFARADRITKQCVIEYISDNRLVDERNITELFKLYNITRHQNIALLCVQYINYNITSNIHHVRWEELSRATICDVIPQINCGKMEYLLLECVMRWVDAHHTDTPNIRLLLATVCYHNVPEQYLTHVLLPHLAPLLPGIKQLKCSLHDSHKQAFRPVVLTRAVPPELYLLKPFELFVKCYTLRLDKYFSDEPLKLVRSGKRSKSGGADKGYFVMFDKDTPLGRYPVAPTLNLTELREIVEKHHSLHFMFLI